MQYNKDHVVERMRELAAARVPFVHQGRDLHGIDCVGALAYAFQYRGELPAYPDNPVNGELEIHLAQVFGTPVKVTSRENPIGLDDLQPGDVVSMQYRGPARHVALIVAHVSLPGVLSVIHTDSMVERVTEHILDAKWVRRIVKVWRP